MVLKAYIELEAANAWYRFRQKTERTSTDCHWQGAQCWRSVHECASLSLSMHWRRQPPPPLSSLNQNGSSSRMFTFSTDMTCPGRVMFVTWDIKWCWTVQEPGLRIRCRLLKHFGFPGRYTYCDKKGSQMPFLACFF